MLTTSQKYGRTRKHYQRIIYLQQFHIITRNNKFQKCKLCHKYKDELFSRFFYRQEQNFTIHSIHKSMKIMNNGKIS